MVFKITKKQWKQTPKEYKFVKDGKKFLITDTNGVVRKREIKFDDEIGVA